MLLDTEVRALLWLVDVWLSSNEGRSSLELLYLGLLRRGRFRAKPGCCLLLLRGFPLTLGSFNLLLLLHRQPAGTIQCPLPFGSSLLLLSLIFPRLLLSCLYDLRGNFAEIRKRNAGCSKYCKGDPALHSSVFLRDANPSSSPPGSVRISSRGASRCWQAFW